MAEHLTVSIEANLPAMSTEVHDETERRTVITSIAAEWYRGQAPIEELVARAPMIRVGFEG